jgi:hypothetical protein
MAIAAVMSIYLNEKIRAPKQEELSDKPHFRRLISELVEQYGKPSTCVSVLINGK